MTDYTVVRQVISNFLEVNFEDANVWTSNLHFWIPYQGGLKNQKCSDRAAKPFGTSYWYHKT